MIIVLGIGGNFLIGFQVSVITYTSEVRVALLITAQPTFRAQARYCSLVYAYQTTAQI